MNTPRKSGFAEWSGVAVRWGVGLLFIYMGLSKALDPVDFLKLVRQYDLPVTSFLLNAISGALPWFETFCGILLLLGVCVRGTSLVILAMLAPFTILVIDRALEVASAKQLAFCAVKFDCGCGAGEVFICAKVLENCVLMLLSAWLLTGAGRRLALRYSL